MSEQLTADTDRANRFGAFRLGMRHMLTGKGYSQDAATHADPAIRREYQLGWATAQKALAAAMKRTRYEPSVLRGKDRP